MEYSKIFEVRWADLDPNFHLKNTAYGEYATHVRFSFLSEKGFSFLEFKAQSFGPVIFSEKTEYFKEIGSGQKIRVNNQLGGLSKDGRKWRFQHQIFREDGKEAARLTIDGAWIDLATRKLRVPPEELFSAMACLEKTHDFLELK